MFIWMSHMPVRHAVARHPVTIQAYDGFTIITIMMVISIVMKCTLNELNALICGDKRKQVAEAKAKKKKKRKDGCVCG